MDAQPRHHLRGELELNQLNVICDNCGYDAKISVLLCGMNLRIQCFKCHEGVDVEIHQMASMAGDYDGLVNVVKEGGRS